MSTQNIRGDCKKILMIDDDSDLMNLIEVILRDKGFDVYIHPNSFHLSDIVMLYDPDLIFLNVMLSGKSAIEICKELKKKINTPIILLSAQPKEKVSIIDCDADGLISKPFNIRELLDTIEHHLNTKKFQDLLIE